MQKASPFNHKQDFWKSTSKIAVTVLLSLIGFLIIQPFIRANADNEEVKKELKDRPTFQYVDDKFIEFKEALIQQNILQKQQNDALQKQLDILRLDYYNTITKMSTDIREVRNDLRSLLTIQKEKK